MKRLSRHPRVIPPRPARRVRGRDGAPEDELAVTRARELVPELSDGIWRQLGQQGRGHLVMLVLEPTKPFGAAEHGHQAGGVALPRRRPPFLLRVLRSGLEEETDRVARHSDLEVTVLLVAALVQGEGYPRIVRRVDGR